MNREEKKAIEIVKEFNLKNRYRDGGTINNAIDTVIRMAEKSNESVFDLLGTSSQEVIDGYDKWVDVLQKENNQQKKENVALLEALCITRQKYNNDKARYRRKAKKYRDRINKAKEYINNCIGIEVKEDLRNILNGDSNE